MSDLEMRERQLWDSEESSVGCNVPTPILKVIIFQ